MKSRLSGIDVSHFQGKVDWGKVKAAGVAFAFAKATEGVSYTDAMFATNWQGMQNAGLLRGAYHFFRPSQDAAAQAQHFLSVVSLQSGDLPPALDVETADGVSNDALTAGVQTWLEHVALQTGVTPIIYAGPRFWNGHVNGNFSAYPLWVAEYGVQTPQLPRGWTNWNFWQYSQSGHESGVAGNVDLDYFQGSIEDLTALAGGATHAAAASPGPSTTAGQTYTIQPGDTLGAIAAKLNVPVEALAAANGIQNSNLIRVGQLLQIPG